LEENEERRREVKKEKRDNKALALRVNHIEILQQP